MIMHALRMLDFSLSLPAISGVSVMVMPVNVYGMISTRLFATANTTRWEWTVKLVNLSTMLDLGAEPLQRMLTSVYVSTTFMNCL